MRIAKVRLVIALIIAVAIVTFVIVSTKGGAAVHFTAFGGEKDLSGRVVILLSIGVGFVLGYVFRITRFFVKKTPKHPEE